MTRQSEVRPLTWLVGLGMPERSLGGLARRKIPKARNVRRANPNKDQQLFVPYEDGGNALGIQGYVMGVDGSAHTEQRALIGPALAVSADHEAECLERLDQVMAQNLIGNTAIDLKPIFELAVLRWCAHVFGIAQSFSFGTVEADLLDVGRAVMNRTLFNTELMRAFDSEQAASDVEVVNAFRDWLTVTYGEKLQTTIPGSVAHRLSADPLTEPIRDVIGLIGGASELLVESAISILDWAIVDEKNWALAHERSLSASGPEDFEVDVRDLMSLAPPQYFLIRKSNPDQRGAEQPLTLVSLLEGNSGNPNDPVDGAVAGQSDSVFGIAPHHCLGRNLAVAALAHILHPIFRYRQGQPMPRYKTSTPPKNLPVLVRLVP